MKNVLCMALFSMSALLFSCNGAKQDESKAAPADSVAAVPPKPQPAEFADPKYMEMGKTQLAALSAGDVDKWLSNFSDDAVYQWNGGDSLAGKAAISAYWKKRRGEVIDSISFSEEIWLPIKVNQPQSVEQPGVWLLGWYRVSAKYKNGHKMSQFIHSDAHFNADGKIDRYIQYIDRSLINAALKK